MYLEREREREMYTCMCICICMCVYIYIYIVASIIIIIIIYIHITHRISESSQDVGEARRSRTMRVVVSSPLTSFKNMRIYIYM